MVLLVAPDPEALHECCQAVCHENSSLQVIPQGDTGPILQERSKGLEAREIHSQLSEQMSIHTLRIRCPTKTIELRSCKDP